MDHAGIGDEKVYILGMQTGRVARHEKNPQCEKFAAIFLSLLRGLLDVSVETGKVASGKSDRLDQWCRCSH
jgi:hypothetical protein